MVGSNVPICVWRGAATARGRVAGAFEAEIKPGCASTYFRLRLGQRIERHLSPAPSAALAPIGLGLERVASTRVQIGFIVCGRQIAGRRTKARDGRLADNRFLDLYRILDSWDGLDRGGSRCGDENS